MLMTTGLSGGFVSSGVRRAGRTPLFRHAGQWALFGFLVSAQACFGFDLGPRDPLFQLGRVPASPASAMMASPVASHGCTEGPEATYTLLDVVENALCHNPKTRAAWANVKAQAAQVGVAKAAYLPTLTGSVQAVKDRSTSQGTNVVPFSVASNSTYHNDTLTLNWVLYDFGLRSATVDNAEKMLTSAKASQDNVLQTVFATAVKDYYAALVAQKNIQATTEIEADAKHVLNAAVARVQKGVAAISDQLQAKTAYSQAVFNRNKAEGDGQSALGTLAIDMGQRPDSSVVLIESDNPAMPESELVRSVGELLQSAQKAHPSLIAARADMEAAFD
jgi:outer membrane protein